MKTCLNCGKELTKTQNKYCCRQCQNEYQRKEYIKLWKNGEKTGITGKNGLSEHIRNYLLKKVDYKCEQCGWSKIHPITGKVPLEIHHIDGNNMNCIEENLQVLCPNCHSLTSNFGSLNREGRGENNSRKNYCLECGTPISAMALRCKDCSAAKRITEKPITREELKQLIRSISFVQIGKMYNVSDNAIRKWCVSYGLPSKKKDIIQYTDDQWELL